MAFLTQTHLRVVRPAKLLAGGSSLLIGPLSLFLVGGVVRKSFFRTPFLRASFTYSFQGLFHLILLHFCHFLWASITFTFWWRLCTCGLHIIRTTFTILGPLSLLSLSMVGVSFSRPVWSTQAASPTPGTTAGCSHSKSKHWSVRKSVMTIMMMKTMAKIKNILVSGPTVLLWWSPQGQSTQVNNEYPRNTSYMWDRSVCIDKYRLQDTFLPQKL